MMVRTQYTQSISLLFFIEMNAMLYLLLKVHMGTCVNSTDSGYHVKQCSTIRSQDIIQFLYTSTYM